MGAMRASFEFSLVVSQQNHSDQSFKALDDALKTFHQKKGTFREQTMWKSAKAKVYDLVATRSHLLRKQKIHKIRAGMEALVYGAENISSTKCRQFQVRLERARQAATSWSDVDRQKAIE